MEDLAHAHTVDTSVTQGSLKLESELRHDSRDNDAVHSGLCGLFSCASVHVIYAALSESERRLLTLSDYMDFELL